MAGRERAIRQQHPSICVHFGLMTPLATTRRWLTCILVLACTGATAAAQDEPPPPPESPELRAVASDPGQRQIVEYKGKTAGIHAGESVRATESTKRLAARSSEIDDLSAQLRAALSLPPASPERADRIDQTFSALRRLVERLRDDRSQAVMALESAIEQRDTALAAVTEDGGGAAELRTAIDAYRAALQAPVDAVQREVDTASAHLTAARKLRRRAQSHASETAVMRARSSRLSEAASEIRSIPIDVRSSIRRTVGEWWRQPKKLNQFQALGNLFLGLLELVVVLGLGIGIHRRLPLWTRRLFTHLDRTPESEGWSSTSSFPRWMISGDIKALGGVTGPIAQDLLVLVLSGAIMAWFAASIPLVAWLALIFATGACIRLAQGAIELALITPAESRPALRVTDEAVRAALLWVVHAFGLLLAVELILKRLLVDILAADRVAEIIDEATALVAVLVALTGLVRWGDTVRSRAVAGGTESPIARWVGAASHGRLLGVGAAAVAVMILAARLAVAVGQSIIENRAGLSWLNAALARRQLHSTSAVQRPPLPLATRNAIGQGSLRMLHVEPYVAVIRDRHRAWTDDPRRGLVAVTGDRGCGKSVVMDAIKQSLDGPVIEAQTPIGTRTPKAALQWLIGVTGIESDPNIESVVEALRGRSPTAFVLSNLHRLYLRTVNGYEGLDAVLAVMQATGRHHFWVASIHGPAWAFLSEMRHIGNVGVFTTRVQIQPLNAADLSAWLLSQTAAAGFQPRFDSMLQRPASGPDGARMLERTERAYWQLLAEASQGNPTVAVRLWVDGLRAADANTALAVTVPQTRDTRELEALEDADLFALTALILHDDMDVHEMGRVLNIREGHVRSICRTLEQLTLISETDAGRYKVRLNWLPAVERHLRRRSFLHKS